MKCCQTLRWFADKPSTGFQHAENTPDAATCFATLGTILEAQGSANEAEKWFVRALKIREHLFGQNDPAVADTRIGLALVYHRESRLEEAAELNILAIAAYRDRYEAKDLPVALNNLGRIRTEQRRSKEAEQLFRKAMAVWEQQLGPTHPIVAAALDHAHWSSYAEDLREDHIQLRHLIKLGH